MPLREAATRHLEILKVTPDLLRFAAERSRAREVATLLRPDNKTELQKWLHGRQAMDVIHDVGVRASLQEWLEVVKRLQPRQYSISSSPLVNPLEVQLTVSAVRFEHRGRPRQGVCSTFLADRCGDRDVEVYLQKSPHFRPPADGDTPMIMVGPGTGVAPFRAFLHDRRERGQQGRNWLFFGERTSAHDFYYRDELEGMRDDGFLTRLSLAFSRDQREKVYVQDRMRQYGADLWAWLQDGAHFYVCGDATRMAKDVDQALRDVAERHGGLDPAEAGAYVKTLSSQKRYVRDVY
jgi:sulfite reductase alpha subunit-like flavoprotein